MAVVIGISVGVSVFIHLERSGSTEAKLVQASQYMNARLPMNVDSSTRWDTTAPGPGNCLTYYYTLVNVSKREIDPEEIIAKMKPKILLNYRTSPDMKVFRDNHVTLRYMYRDKFGETVTVIEVSPNDL